MEPSAIVRPCPGCANPEPLTATTCSSCGLSFTERLELHDPPLIAQPGESAPAVAKPLICPSCGDLASVQKVSAVVNAGRAQSQHAGYSHGRVSDFTSNYRAEVTTWTTLAGSSQTDLSSALAPPLESAPRFFNPNAEGNPWEAIGCLFIAAIIPFGFIVEGLTNGWNPYLGFFALACVLVWLYVAGQFSLHLEARRIYIARQPLRDLIWYEWNRLYFCHRCDGVFLPEEGRLVASTQMPAYVTELAEVEMAANR